ncbi:hypothetical protein J6590_072155 [Homalodisca vitripennis]|nr:hypothetical protein J6590_072155 [Homalodisca vitripennis]
MAFVVCLVPASGVRDILRSDMQLRESLFCGKAGGNVHLKLTVLCVGGSGRLWSEFKHVPRYTRVQGIVQTPPERTYVQNDGILLEEAILNFALCLKDDSTCPSRFNGPACPVTHASHGRDVSRQILSKF